MSTSYVNCMQKAEVQLFSCLVVFVIILLRNRKEESD